MNILSDFEVIYLICGKVSCISGYVNFKERPLNFSGQFTLNMIKNDTYKDVHTRSIVWATLTKLRFTKNSLRQDNYYQHTLTLLRY